MNIDRNSVKLIIDVYRKINALKSLLKDTSYSDFTGFLGSGNIISTMVTKALEDTSATAVVESLSETEVYIHDLNEYSSKNHGIKIRNKAQISSCLIDILNDLQLLQVNINKHNQ